MKYSIPKNYYAFISYSRLDSVIAKFVKNKIEKFKYSKFDIEDTLKPNEEHFLRYIFLDKDDLGYSCRKYREDIEKILAHVKFLIVLCSPYSKISDEVEWEIRQFIKYHPNHKDRIIPVIISGNPGKKDDPIHPILKQFEISERNLPNMSTENKYFKKKPWTCGIAGVISYMIQIDHRLIQRDVLKLNAFIPMNCITTIIIIILSFLWYYDRNQLIEKNISPKIMQRNEFLINEKKNLIYYDKNIKPIHYGIE